MADKQIVRPSFSSEKEEAEWWYNNPDYILQEFDRAKTEGRLGHGTAKRRMEEIAAQQHGAIELDAADAALAAKLAERKGLERQVYLKELIHNTLLKEQESLDRSSAA